MKKIGWLMVLMGLAAVLLAACGGNAGQQDQSDSGAKPAAGGSETKAGGQKVTIKVWDWQGGQEMESRKRVFANFMEKNPDIQIDYSPLGSNYTKAILLALKSGDDIPDIFTLPTNTPLPQGVSEGWVQSLEPYLSEGFRERFYDGALVEGLHTLNGEVYTAPYGKVFSVLLYYNKDLFVKAGLDPEAPPRTFGELRETARKITEAGKGEFYGYIEGGKQTGRFDYGLTFLAMTAGAIDYRAGVIPEIQQANYSSDGFVQAVELYKQMYDDGSFYPSSLSLVGMEARQFFGEGKAAMMIQAPVTIGPWMLNNPDLNLGIAELPVPDSGRKGYLYANYDRGEVLLSKGTKHPAEATRVIEYILSEEGMTELFKNDGRMSSLKSMDSPEFYPFKETITAYEVEAKQLRIAPSITTRNAAINDVISQYAAVTPDFGQIVQGVLAGSVPDYRAAAAELDKKAREQLEAAMAKAKQAGAAVDWDDFKFPNWSPERDYLSEQYAELK